MLMKTCVTAENELVKISSENVKDQC